MREDCFEWPNGKTAAGYGQMTIRGKVEYAHRVFYEAAHGPIPEGHVVRHTCDNPPCVNPNHLVSGTQLENMADMVARGRSGKLLTPDQEAEVRARHAAGESFDSMAPDFGASSVTVGAAVGDDAPGRGVHVKKLTWRQRELALDLYRSGSRIGDIARRLGVTDGAIYYHINKTKKGVKA